MINLENKTVIVTGGGSGVGQSIVKVFAKAHANVAFTYCSSTSKAEKLVEELNEYNVKGYRLDQKDIKTIKPVLKTIKKDFGRIDILVNNAGIYPNKPILDLKEKEWDEMFETNTKAIFFLSREAYKLMEDNSKIVNISSINATNPNPNLAHYGASKAAVEMITRSLAQDFGPKTRVNCIAPGLIYREGIEKAIPTWVDSYTLRSPLKSLVMPEEIGNTALFLASDLSSGITGQIITVDKGISLAAWFDNN